MNLSVILDEGGHLDRRQRKTRIAIEISLIELLSNKPLNKITISELAAKADVNRKTFYNNFASIQDVLSSIENQFIQFIVNSLPKTITIENEIGIYDLYLDFATIIEPYKSIMRKIFFHERSLILRDNFQARIFPYIERNFQFYHVDPDIVPYINRYIIDGVLSIFREWCMENDSLTTRQIALLLYNLTLSAINLDNYRDLQSDPCSPRS